MRILLAEDDKQLNKALSYQLKNLGYQVDCCFDGDDALFYAEQNIYDVILLDWMLPHIEGTDIIYLLRKRGITTPIILITALGTLSDKVKGLDVGADDYLVKPFAFEELMARIRCVTRRSLTFTSTSPKELSLCDICLKLDEGTLKGPGGQCSLSPKEAMLLETMMRMGTDTSMTRTSLLLKVWGPDNDVEDGNLDNYIHFLRRRLENVKSSLKIKTLRGIGYCLTDSQK